MFGKPFQEYMNLFATWWLLEKYMTDKEKRMFPMFPQQSIIDAIPPKTSPHIFP